MKREQFAWAAFRIALQVSERQPIEYKAERFRFYFFNLIQAVGTKSLAEQLVASGAIYYVV